MQEKTRLDLSSLNYSRLKIFGALIWLFWGGVGSSNGYVGVFLSSSRLGESFDVPYILAVCFSNELR